MVSKVTFQWLARFFEREAGVLLGQRYLRVMRGIKVLQAYWVRFAHSGDPNGPALPRWPRYDLTQRSYMDFAPTGPQLKSDLRGAICALLHRV
jgi:carboxylesterase type B